MATTGLLVETDDHAKQLVGFAKAMIAAAALVRTPLGGPVRIRVGIHSGRVMSGIVGTLRSRYCLFGGVGSRACTCCSLRCSPYLQAIFARMMSSDNALFCHCLPGAVKKLSHFA
jgi:hypothetical protein